MQKPNYKKICLHDIISSTNSRKDETNSDFPTYDTLCLCEQVAEMEHFLCSNTKGDEVKLLSEILYYGIVTNYHYGMVDLGKPDINPFSQNKLIRFANLHYSWFLICEKISKKIMTEFYLKLQLYLFKNILLSILYFVKNVIYFDMKKLPMKHNSSQYVEIMWLLINILIKMVFSNFPEKISYSRVVTDKEWYEVCFFIFLLLGSTANRSHKLMERPAYILAFLDPHGRWVDRVLNSFTSTLILSLLIEKSEIARDMTTRCYLIDSTYSSNSIYCLKGRIKPPGDDYEYIASRNIECIIYFNSLSILSIIIKNMQSIPVWENHRPSPIVHTSIVYDLKYIFFSYKSLLLEGINSIASILMEHLHEDISKNYFPSPQLSDLIIMLSSFVCALIDSRSIYNRILIDPLILTLCEKSICNFFCKFTHDIKSIKLIIRKTFWIFPIQSYSTNEKFQNTNNIYLRHFLGYFLSKYRDYLTEFFICYISSRN